MSKYKVDIKAKSSDTVNDVDRTSDEDKYIRTGDEANEEFDGKPSVTDTLYVKESVMCVCSMFV